MGQFSVDVELEGPAGREQVTMLVDSGALYCTIPDTLATRLAVQPVRHQRFELADGQELIRPVAEVRLIADGRSTTTWVVLMPSGRPLLGAYGLEGLGLGIDPANQRLIPVTGFLGALPTPAGQDPDRLDRINATLDRIQARLDAMQDRRIAGWIEDIAHAVARTAGTVDRLAQKVDALTEIVARHEAWIAKREGAP
jgi:aspartyl protease family protein